MGFIGSLLGSGPEGSQSGMNFRASSIPLTNVATNAQADTTYSQAQQALAQQQAFLQALQGQNGIQNQSNVYNQLQNIAAGNGPNPAQTALANATGANTANTAALMAGQRGAGANVGLIARQAGMQGAANQQNLAGQAANLQANQSLNALGQLSGVAGQQVGQQAGAVSGLNQAAQSEQGNILGAVANQNNANVSLQNGINAANAGVQSGIAGTQGRVGSGVINGVSSGISSLGMAQGGEVPMYSEGSANVMPAVPTSGPQSFVGQYLFGSANKMNPTPANPAPVSNPLNLDQKDPEEQAGESLGQTPFKVISNLMSSSTPALSGAGDASTVGGASIMPLTAMSKGGKVPAMVSPGERYLPPAEVKKVADGKKEPIKAGEKILGKAKVKGNSYANDTVPKTLESGGIVLPRSVTEAKDPAQAAHDFVSAILAKNKGLKR